MLNKYNIKVSFNDYITEYENCYLINDLNEYKEYIDILLNKFNVSESEIKNIKTFIGHGYSQLTGISTMFSGTIEEKDKRQPILVHLKYLEAMTLKGQLEFLLKGEKLVINKNGGYFPIKKDQKFEITKTLKNKYTVDDIKINKWYGGNHYYVKIDTIDVIDDNGDVKWNTIKRAKEIALKYLDKLNSI